MCATNRGCSSLESVSIPESVTKIMDYAFRDCSCLKNVTIPVGVTEIGEGAFSYCTNLTTAIIPEGVTKIGKSAFYKCSNLTSITIPKSLTCLDDGIFSGCYNLTTVNLQEGLKEIGQYAFQSTPITSIVIPRSLKRIHSSAFNICKQLSVIKFLPLSAPEYVERTSYSKLFDSKQTIHVYETSKGYDVAPWTEHTIKYDIPLVAAKNVAIPIGNLQIEKGEQTTIQATITPSDVTINEVEWSSTDENVLKNLGDGLFEGVSDGYAYVRATTVDGSNLTAKCRVSVGNVNFVDVSAVAIEPSTLTLHKGESGILQATVAPEDASFKSVVWSSSNEKIATVDENGKVTAQAKGTATITATSEDNDNVEATCTISVLAPYTKSLKMSQTDVYMDTFETLRLTASPTPSDAEPKVKWSSDNEQVVKVSSNGTLTPTGEGFAVITAKATDGSNASAAASVTVKHAPYNPYLSSKETGYSTTTIGGVTTTRINFELANNGSETIKVTRVAVRDYDFKETLSSTDASLLGTLAPGKKLGLSHNTSGSYYEWEYTYKGETYTYCSWKTYPIVAESVTLDKTSLNLALGETAKLTATVSPMGAKSEVEWESSNTQVVTIGNDGNVRTVGPGKATITATSTDGTHRKATCEVTVTKYDVTKLSLKESSCNLEIGSSVTLEPTITPANAYNKNLVWTSSNEDVAMVNSSGKVVGIAKGEAVITVASEEHPEVTASVTIKVIPVLVKSITLNHTNYTLERGENIQLVATLLPENAPNKAVKWSTDNEDVIMVSNSGRCVYLADGKATVTATTCDGSNLSASCLFNCTDGIITITTDSPDLEFFTIDGRRINKVQKGVNIIRTEDGKTVKVMNR